MRALTGRQRSAAYALLFAAAFLLALRQTFPVEAVRDRLVLEAAAQGWHAKVVEVAPAGLLGIRLGGLALESRDGTRLALDDLRATLRIWPLLLGRRGVDFDARLLGGRVRGLVEQGGSARRLVAEVRDLDLVKATALRRAIGLDLAGTLAGDLDVTLDLREPARSSGSLQLRVERAGVLGGQLQLPSFGGALTVPRADLGALLAQAAVRDGKASFEKLEARSADLELVGEGIQVTLQPRLAASPVFGKARLQLKEGFWERSGSPALRGVAELALAQARGRDGSYHFQIFGTLAQPQARGAP
jgi:type II secretion system protein N